MKTKQDNVNHYLRADADRRLKNILTNVMLLFTMLPEHVVKSCITCDNFEEETETCKKFNARPPARIIAIGCGDYENINEDIPF